MREWNHCQFIGVVGTQPKESLTANRNPITTFSLGVGQGKDKKTLWLFVRHMAQVNFDKKAKVKIVGRLFYDTWTKDGKSESLWGLFADSIEVVGNPSEESVDEPF